MFVKTFNSWRHTTKVKHILKKAEIFLILTVPYPFIYHPLFSVSVKVLPFPTVTGSHRMSREYVEGI